MPDNIPYSDNGRANLGGLRNVLINQTTLADAEVIKYDAVSQLWKNAPDGASGGNAATIDVQDNTTDNPFKPTFISGVAGVNKTLNCSNTNWTINPGTGEFLFLPTIKVGGAVSNGRTAVGANAGAVNAGLNTTAIGNSAGQTDMGANAVSIGYNAGLGRQAAGAVAIGFNSANDRQGRGSIAIGNSAADGTPQPDNQVCINTSGIPFTGADAQACYINQLARRDTGLGAGLVSYDFSTHQLTYSGT